MRYWVGIRVGYGQAAFTAFLPDLDSVAQADTVEQAVAKAHELATKAIDALRLVGKPIPPPTPQRDLFERMEYRGCFWVTVALDTTA